MQAQEKRAKAAKMGPQAASSSAADDNGNEVESDAKRIKTANETPDAEQKTEVVVKKPQKVPRCSICKQYEDQVTFYEGHPTNSVDEFVSLTDDRLMLFTGNEAYIHQEDALPSVKITAFNIYDKHGHLVPIDSGLIERDVLLYVSGYVKPIFDEDDDPETGVPTHDIGPINAWYVSGYDGGERAILLFNSPYADYYMMTPSAAYEPVMRSLNEKIKIAKLVVEFLLDEAWQQPTYEDLLVELACYMNPRINEECLLRHAQFVVDQILSIDQSAADGDAPLIATPCVRTLVKIAGVTFAKRKWMVRVEKGQQRAPAKSSAEFSKATTTPLVRDVMESFFTDQIAIGAEAAGGGGGGNGPKKKRCGVCEACQQADCGKCNYCRDMLKFGGSGKMKQACMQRRCPNMAIQAAEDSDIDDADDADTIILDDTTVPCSRRIVNDVFWTAEPIAQHNGRKYYLSARVGKAQISPGDFVIMNPLEPNHPLIVAEIAYMWEDAEQGPMFHARLFIRGADTILGETSDPREIFVQDICEACPLGAIVRLAVVEKRLPPPNWATNGGTEGLAPLLDDDGQTFFFSKRYDAEHARFVDIDYDEMDENLISTCAACVSRYNKKLFYIPTLNETVITYMGVQYKPGSGVYLNPGTFSFTKVKMEKPEDEKPLKPDYDSELYPEFYRKSNDVKGSNTETGEPFCLGIIEAVWADEEDIKNSGIKLRVRKMYRPENTHKGELFTQQCDLNMLYYSNEEEIVDFNAVQGKCYISYGHNIEESLTNWIVGGPDRFYFSEIYDASTASFEDVPASAMRFGSPGKCAANSKKNKCKMDGLKTYEMAPKWARITPMRCLDVFAGCGGLSKGLHASGVAQTRWAIEKDGQAALAFRHNNPYTTVFTTDCNALLRDVMQGNHSAGMPRKGEVEMLVGGPPCQGFSGMNRFNAGQYSLFKNSLIVSYLSYCDFYRPNYFILENVRNFVSFKKSLVLKLTLRCLLAMGYQVTFGVVQAGHYGVAQTRRRMIIYAAAPGYELPKYPEPLHVFSKRGCHLSVQVGNKRYTNGTRWLDSAPLRSITVFDAMGDLPAISNGCSAEKMLYLGEAHTHFQRLIRRPGTTISDHMCKDMTPLVEARMSYIPLAPGSDWRDLPNIVVRLSDGTYTNKLRYEHRTKRQLAAGDDAGEAPRGVCQCAVGRAKLVCDPSDRQVNTLIPWCLPHTADRHNHWAGLYGRLEWGGYFSTTVTNPEPMGKQGRVLHPEQHRVVSVRECARSQGFPDSYEFIGTTLDRHRQVGNAVPPPLGLALGREIIKAYLASNR